MSGSAVVMPWIDGPAATLLLWYPGMEGGHALAGILDGTVAPSGRLPFAIPAAESDLVHFDPDATTETYDLFHGQWHLDRTGVPAAFPFGSGLSTTTFALDDDVHVTRDHRAVGVHVRNTGARAGDRGRAGLRQLPDLGVRASGGPARRLRPRPTSSPGAVGASRCRSTSRCSTCASTARMHREPGTVRLRVAFDATDPGVVTEVSV